MFPLLRQLVGRPSDDLVELVDLTEPGSSSWFAFGGSGSREGLGGVLDEVARREGGEDEVEGEAVSARRRGERNASLASIDSEERQKG